MASIAWTRPAREDVDAIERYIAHSSPETAARFIGQQHSSVSRLRQFPESGRPVPKIVVAGFREVIFRNYRVIYRLRNDIVVVHGIIHGRRDLRAEAGRGGMALTASLRKSHMLRRLGRSARGRAVAPVAA